MCTEGIEGNPTYISNGSSLEELKEKSSIYEDKEEKLGMGLNVH